MLGLIGKTGLPFPRLYTGLHDMSEVINVGDGRTKVQSGLTSDVKSMYSTFIYQDPDVCRFPLISIQGFILRTYRMILLVNARHCISLSRVRELLLKVSRKCCALGEDHKGPSTQLQGIYRKP